MNYRTMASCQQSRRMRQVLQEFQDSQGVGDDGPGIISADGVGDTQQDRVAALEDENRKLRETVEA